MISIERSWWLIRTGVPDVHSLSNRRRCDDRLPDQVSLPTRSRVPWVRMPSAHVVFLG